MMERSTRFDVQEPRSSPPCALVRRPIQSVLRGDTPWRLLVSTFKHRAVAPDEEK